MASWSLITCVNKTDRQNPYERITHVGGLEGGGWRLTQEDVVRRIETNAWEFYTNVRGNRAKVIVAVSRFGNKYLKTESDKGEENNLLSLPECPRS